MFLGVVAAATKWEDRWSVWTNRGLIVVIVMSTSVLFLRWGWGAVRQAPSRESFWNWSLMGPTLTTMFVLLVVVLVGVLLLTLQGPNQHFGSCWLLIGLMGFAGPRSWPSTQTLFAKPRQGLAWLTPNRLEIMSSCLMMTMGLLSLF